jgi:hypothetical protein
VPAPPLVLAKLLAWGNEMIVINIKNFLIQSINCDDVGHVHLEILFRKHQRDEKNKMAFMWNPESNKRQILCPK